MADGGTPLATNNWSVDHIGHAIRDLEASTARYVRLFGFKPLIREKVQEFQVEVQFLECGNTKIELLAPLPGNDSLNKFLEKRGEGLHHICYRVASVEIELQRLTALGVELVDKTPRKGAHGMSVAFLHPRSTGGVLVELCCPA